MSKNARRFNKESRSTSIPKDRSQHTVNKHIRYQEGGPNDKNGYHNFQLSGAQQECLETIENNIITFVHGRAGVGKSLAAFYFAVKQYLNNPAMRIIVIRTPVEAGQDKIGFLPSDLKEKLEPHFSSTKLLLEQLLNPQKVQADIEGPYKRIQFLIPNFAIGTTWDNAIICIDEAQQIQPLIMKLLLERIGVNSKVIVMGDPSQVYSGDKNRQGMSDAISKFFDKDTMESKYPDVGYFQFSIDDCMRSDIVKTVLQAYDS